MRKKLNRINLTEEIYQIIKEQILNHELAPGTKINIDKLSRELEVSNIPIREVLSRFSTEGLVKVVPFKGVFVTKMTIRDLDEIFELRTHLEVLALEKSILLIPDDELNKLEEQFKSMNVKEIKKELNLESVMKMNEDIHGLILKYCGNETLKRSVTGYIERIQRYISFIYEDIEESYYDLEYQEHYNIIDKLINKNVDEAKEALRYHLVNSHKRTRPYFV